MLEIYFLSALSLSPSNRDTKTRERLRREKKEKNRNQLGRLREERKKESWERETETNTIYIDVSESIHGDWEKAPRENTENVVKKKSISKRIFKNVVKNNFILISTWWNYVCYMLTWSDLESFDYFKLINYNFIFVTNHYPLFSLFHNQICYNYISFLIVIKLIFPYRI